MSRRHSLRAFARTFGRPLAAVAAAFALVACAAAPPPRAEAVYFPQPPQPPRLQFLRAISRPSDVAPPRSGLDTLLFGEQKDDGEIQRPFGCAVSGDKVYVTDSRFGALLQIDLRAGAMTVLDLPERARPQKPIGICSSPNGNLYYADVERRQVVVLDKDLHYVAEYGPFADDSRPVDVDVSFDRLYVTDAGSRVVRVLDRKTGAPLFTFGNTPTQDELLRGPTACAVDEHGYCYVTDTVYCRVYVFDRDGKFVRHIGEPGDVVGQFARPKGIACNANTVWVVDTAFENCQVFALDGEPLLFFGGPGSTAGRLTMPGSIWIGRDGLDLFADRIDPDFEAEQLVVVTSQFGPNKLSFYALGKSKRFTYPDAALPSVPPAKTPAVPKPVDANAPKDPPKAK